MPVGVDVVEAVADVKEDEECVPDGDGGGDGVRGDGDDDDANDHLGSL